MLAHIQFLEEKNQIEALIADGYQMTDVTENLSGSFVEFERLGDKKVLHLITAEGRKYFATILVAKLRGA